MFRIRKEKGSGQTPILGHEALSLELLNGDLGGLGEEKHIPVLIAHVDDTQVAILLKQFDRR